LADEKAKSTEAAAKAAKDKEASDALFKILADREKNQAAAAPKNRRRLADEKPRVVDIATCTKEAVSGIYN
jgi:hypothetical protein